MKKTLIIFVLALITGISVSAQTVRNNPDFSGTWILDKKKSRIVKPVWADELVIEHSDPEIKITRKIVINGVEKSFQRIFYTDKRGDKSPISTGSPDDSINSETFWQKNKIVNKYKYDVEGNSKLKVSGTRTYKLSKDGKTLVLSELIYEEFYLKPITSPGLSRTSQKLIYRKQ